MNRVNSRIILLATPLFLISTSITSVIAQQAAPAAIEEVAVTGSFIRRAENESIPLTLIGANEISSSSANSLIELIDRLPATSGNFTTQNSDEQGNGVVAAVNLRNMGNDGTLVLLNGKRQMSLRAATDVNGLVPQVMLRSIEVVKDGASSIYGSEAVAGVVNFITNTNFEGVRLDAGLSEIEAADDPNGNIGIMVGTRGADTSIVAALEYNRRSTLFTPDRFDQDRIVEFGQRSIFGNPGSFLLLPPMGPPQPDPLCGSEQLGGVPDAGRRSGPFCQFDLTQNRAMTADQERVVGYTTVEHTLDATTQIQLEAGFSHAEQERSDGARFPLTNNNPLPVVPASNPFNPFGRDAMMFYRLTTNVPGHPLSNITEAGESTYRASGNFIKDLTDTWSLTVGANYTQATSTFDSFDTDYQRFIDALNCRGGASGTECFNPFATALLAAPGDPEYNNPALLDWVTHRIQNKAESELWTVELLLNGEIANPISAAGRIGLALGYQHREESASADPDQAAQNGELFFLPPAAAFSAERGVDAVFIEAFVPLLDAVELNLAGRYDDYDTGESTFTPKVSLLWRAHEHLNVRASVGTSFRVASLDQLLGGVQLDGVGNDPVTGLQFNGVGVNVVPNSGLDPEEGVNWNLGFSWTPTDELLISVDHFSIDLDDRIYTENLVSLLNIDPFHPRVLRDAANNITGATLTTQNGGGFKTSGFDFDVNYLHPTKPGNFIADLQATYVLEYDIENQSGVVSDGVGSYNRLVAGVAPLARFKANLMLGLNLNNGVGLATIIRHTSKVEQDDPTLIGNTEEKSWTTADLQLSWNYAESRSVTFSVDNITDSDPPAVGNSIYTVDPLLYDIRGKTWTVSFSADF